MCIPYFLIVAIPYRGGLLGSGSGPILYAYLYCNGKETLLSQCTVFRSLTLGTTHFRDAGVRCLNESKSMSVNIIANDIIDLKLGANDNYGEVHGRLIVWIFFPFGP